MCSDGAGGAGASRANRGRAARRGAPDPARQALGADGSRAGGRDHGGSDDPAAPACPAAGSAGTPNFARRFWDAAYASDEDLEHWHRDPPDEALARLVANGLLRDGGARMLDVGCGTGAEARWLARRGHAVVALDLSLEALARGSSARDGARGGRWLPVVGTAFELPLGDDAVDWVLDAGCLHSIGRSSRVRYARELARVASPGARLLIRGARADCAEEGVSSVDAVECRRWLAPGFEVEWTMPIELPAASGALDGVAVLLRRTRSDR
ncbi:MAG TPA: class I SAM-dependent methyltransferase [Thermoanaerobaculia bacterium]|nr:class I SAM-dependent methyltransferase [Thermoanaerobaculia bacterium]